jgi:AraC family transcriptional regulator
MQEKELIQDPNQRSSLVHSGLVMEWQGIIIDQRFDPAGEWSFPAFSEHLICINLGQTVSIEQVLYGKSHQATFVRGNSTVLPAGTPVTWRFCDVLDHIHLRLSPSLIAQVAQETTEVDPSRIEIINDFCIQDSRIEYIGLALAAELKLGGTTGRLYIDSLAIALAAHLLRHHSVITSPTLTGSHGLSAKWLSLLDYIHEHLANDLSLAELASVVGVSQSHFSSIFRQNIGLSPHQYLLRQRVERAKRMLLESNLSIAEIATSVGFYDQSHLTRHMQRLFNISPKRLRQQK